MEYYITSMNTLTHQRKQCMCQLQSWNSGKNLVRVWQLMHCCGNSTSPGELIDLICFINIYQIYITLTVNSLCPEDIWTLSLGSAENYVLRSLSVYATIQWEILWETILWEKNNWLLKHYKIILWIITSCLTTPECPSALMFRLVVFCTVHWSSVGVIY